jgi:DNA polymerase-3 subunit alpha
MDLLGLDTLSAINSCLDLVRKYNPDGPLKNFTTEVKTIRDLIRLFPKMDDKNVYKKIFSIGRALGTFQCDSYGLRNLLCKIRASSFEDLAAAIALYRPGPLDSGMVDSFIRRRNKEESEEVWHEELRKYLDETHGLPIYQEQIMFASVILCGFSMAEADNLRKVIGKKKKEDILKFRSKFVDAAVKKGLINKEKADSIYDQIEFFGRYAFNKSHSAAYAVITYYTGWLKYYYPEYWMSALLNKFVATELESHSEGVKTSKKDDEEKIQMYIAEVENLGIKIEAPTINSGYSFEPSGRRSISFGLGVLKGTGLALKELLSLGPWTNIVYFLKDCKDKKINASVITKLYDLGLFEPIKYGGLTAYLLENYRKPCRCTIKEGKAKSTCKLCNGNGLSKPKSIMTDIKEAENEEDLNKIVQNIESTIALFPKENEEKKGDKLEYPAVFIR